MSDKSFTTHLGDVVSGKELRQALHHVAEEFKGYAYAIYDQDPYASHVSEDTKQLYLVRDVLEAEHIKTGASLHNFTIAQRVNTYLTGDCIPLFGKSTNINVPNKAY